MPRLGQVLGLIHSEECKEAFRRYQNEQSQENKTAMFKAKKGCKLCTFKYDVRKS